MASKQLIVKGEGAGCDGINEHLIEAEEGQTELLLDGNESKARCSRRFWLIAAILTTIACATVVAVGGVAFFVLRPPPPPPSHLFPADDGQHGPRKMVAVMEEPLQEQEIVPSRPAFATPSVVAEESQTKPTPLVVASERTEDSNNDDVLAVVPAGSQAPPANSGESSEAGDAGQSTSDDALWSDDDFLDEDLFGSYDDYSTDDYDEDEEEDYDDDDDDDDDFYRDVIDPDYYRYYGNDESDDTAQKTADVGDKRPLPKLDGYDYIVDDESGSLGQAESAEYAESEHEKIFGVAQDEEIPRDKNKWRQSYWADDYGEDVELSEVSDFALDYGTENKVGDKKAEEAGAFDDGKAVEKTQTQPESDWDLRQSEQADDDYGDDQDNGYAEY